MSGAGPGAACSSCGEALTVPSRYCPGCGSVIDAGTATPTRTLHAGADPGGTATVQEGPRRSAVSSSPSSPSSDSSDHGRFVPGTLLLERYRILGLLGRGGMGEVYRADDLRLGQTVALKFLPADLARDPGRLARFHSEVRLARQVSHPSVCRVYDLGDLDGQPFLSMEYIDGENLATLLRRIGRLPSDKATEVARQICAGLSAAHERGVVHRDLKPGNVMLDGRGRARIADFGLAGVLGIDDGTRAGTPAYMSPEQLRGGDTGVASDIYALGLVLYELYTGKRAFRGETMADLARSRDTGPPSPSSLVEGLDPAVERVVLRCLETDPRLRPASALSVAAALPGGDPLAMALAAGETPSPEMVAAAGEEGSLRPGVVAACLGVIVVAILAGAALAGRVSIVPLARPAKSTEVLVDRAHDILGRIGWGETPADSNVDYGWHRTYLEHVEEHDPARSRWGRLSRPMPPAIYILYRQSPAPLRPFKVSGVVDSDDPPPLRPGMVQVGITTAGNLWRFDAVPPQIDEGGTPGAEPDWEPLFAAAGLRSADFRSSEPRWVPPVYADARRAWDGATPGSPEFPLHIEAASYRGRPVGFNLYWPWNRPLRAQPFQQTAGERISQTVILLFIISTVIAGIILARRNLAAGRGDRKGAFRLAGFMATLTLAGGLAEANHYAVLQHEWSLLEGLLALALYQGMLFWILYVAAEPTLRRRWPDRIIAWNRLLSGRFSDPLVGRDLLLGVAAGTVSSLLSLLQHVVPMAIGRPAPAPWLGHLSVLVGPQLWASTLCGLTGDAVTQAVVLLFLLLGLRMLFRQALGAALTMFSVAWFVMTLFSWDEVGYLGMPLAAAIAALMIYVLVRHGLLAVTAMFFTVNLLGAFVPSLEGSAWYARPGQFALAVLAALVLFAARGALAGRPLLSLRPAEA
jgi:hypothetical protein